ncbi:MAG: phosphoribosylamine--glycine ligase [Candidatus Levybacteria bacterium RIFCSPHIGHO2_01_FULL_40_15b]|nr:MAG: phosphoribosylamine--glycine ligase [Candidatus Levybacteria bacterium RIFCSPHIGHO2_01_FULL_40_15b]
MKERGATVAIIGSGGAEAALVHKYSQSPHVDRLIVIPGNDMMREVSLKPVETFQTVKATDVGRISRICHDEGVRIADIRQERAVEADMAQILSEFDITVIGPTRRAGILEWDKTYGRAIATLADIPQPNYEVFNDINYIKEVLLRDGDRVRFVKAAGLADGKGAMRTASNEEVLRVIEKLKREYPDATFAFLFEEEVIGEEFSAFAVSDGKSFIRLGEAQDNKREYDGDLGENTGGMGANNRPIVVAETELQEGIETIFQKTFDMQRKMKQGKHPYRGVLFLGGMVTERAGEKEIVLVEYNARWGDPEAQVIVPGLKVDFFELGMAIAEGRLRNLKIENDGKARVAVAGVSKGYPRDYSQVKGKEIRGFTDAKKVDGVTIYGAAVKVEEGKYFANGGRLFYVVGEGEDVIQARQRAYEAMERISVEGNNLHYRTDIGWRDVERMRNPE